MTANAHAVAIHYMKCCAYLPVWESMREYTRNRHAESQDELWLLEHEPVFTLGQAGKWEHVLEPGDIPVISTDRGGQVTYHGPGQLIIYTLFDLCRRNIGVHAFVALLQQSVIDFLASHGIASTTQKHAPGVYVHGAKLAALGLRVRNGCCYHGLSINVVMDLEPFSRINPCGYKNLPVTQLSDLGLNLPVRKVGQEIAAILAQL